MKVHFPRAAVVALVAHAKASPEHHKPYGNTSKDNPPGLILVGDQGVYLMSSGRPAMADDAPGRVVYCRESDPTAPGADFDVWYENKRAIFGGDDGCELLPLAGIEQSLTKGVNRNPKAQWFTMLISKRGISV